MIVEAAERETVDRITEMAVVAATAAETSKAGREVAAAAPVVPEEPEVQNKSLTQKLLALTLAP
jgi:hypothetical protein